MSVKDQLRQIETHLQNIIESAAAKLVAAPDLKNLLANELVTAMAADLLQDSDRVLAPNHFVVRLAPNVARELQQNPSLLASLAKTIEDQGQEAGLTFSSTPNITILEDQDLSPAEIRTSARRILGPTESTRSLDIERAGEPPQIPANAFLIINGNQVFPLTQPVVNIGRRIDNNMVIDDASISRLHAQLRAIDEHFVIFDLDSTGGTFVNGQKVKRSVLYPGDVIALAAVQLVYGQDAPRPLDEAPSYNQPAHVDDKKTVTRGGERPKNDAKPAAE